MSQVWATATQYDLECFTRGYLKGRGLPMGGGTGRRGRFSVEGGSGGSMSLASHMGS